MNLIFDRRRTPFSDSILARYSKVQFSKIATYWAILSFALSLIWSTLLNFLKLQGVGPAVSLLFPAILGFVISLVIYYRRNHQVLDYDDIGYSITRGKGDPEHHNWSEFKECSVVRDRYDRKSVRFYVSKSDNFVETDTLSSGVNPYRFRNFASEIIEKIPILESERSDTSRFFDFLEQDIHRRARFVADFNETFRNHKISGEKFQLFAKGSTRPRGFLFSKMLAVTVMPDYQVCLYAADLDSDGGKSQVQRLIRLIESRSEAENVTWSWLLFLASSQPGSDMVEFIAHFGNKGLGIACIDVSTGTMTYSSNQLGRSLGKQLGLGMFIRDMKKRSSA